MRNFMNIFIYNVGSQRLSQYYISLYTVKEYSTCNLFVIYVFILNENKPVL